MKARGLVTILLMIIFSLKIVAGCTSPSISSEPSNTLVCVGGTAFFNVTASGPSLTYQWQVDQGAGFVNLSNIVPYSGVTLPTLTITGVTIVLSDYQYRCIVSNGCAPDDTSSAAIMKVNVPPSISIQPSNVSVCEGGTGSFSVTTSGAGLAYQWQVNTGSGFNNVPATLPYSGDTSATLSITGATNLMNGYVYQCIISGSCSPSITSDADTLTINSLPVITVQSASAIVCDGNNTTISVTITGTGISYQWQEDQGSGFTDLVNTSMYSGVTTSGLTITGASVAMNGYVYQCIATGTCTRADTSNIIPLTVHPVYVNYSSAAICQGNYYLFGTDTLTTPGFYAHNFTSVYGCDSTVYVSLSVSPAYYTTTTSVICAGDSILLGGIYRTAAGVYTYILPTVNGCDSTIENTLSLNPSYHFNQSVNICAGDSALVFGTYQTVAGAYFDNHLTTLGCDSIYAFTLLVNPLYNDTLNANICEGDSLLIGGIYQSTDGSYTADHTSMHGCDSVVTILLTVHPVTTSFQTAGICSNDSVLLGGSYQTTAGTYTDVYTSSFGCDSTIVTTLSINGMPDVSLGTFTSVCDTSAAFVLSGGSPVGGIYSGTGVSSDSVFSAGASGLGTYLITYSYTNTAGCIASASNTIIVTVCLGVNELQNDESFSVYPNPFKDQFTITSTADKPVQLMIYNVLGELIKTQEIKNDSFNIDMSNVLSGVYFVKINTDEKTVTLKIIKE